MKKNREKLLLRECCVWKKAFRIKFMALILCLSITTITAQNVTLKLKNASFIEIANEIRKQTSLTFLYNDDKVSGINGIDVDFSREDVRKVLDKCFEGTDLTYVIEDNTVIVTPAKRNAQQNQVVIAGKVTDVSGDPLPGVNVYLKGTTMGTSANVDGTFRFSLPAQEDIILVFSFMGFDNKEVKYNGEEFLNVVMEEDISEIEEVVVMGMFTRKAESFTGSASTFTNADLKRVGNQNLLMSLKNLDPSFIITDNLEFGSDPNRLPQMQLRGQTSIADLRGEYQSDPNQPLFILDGFETTVEKVYDLDMNLVQNVTLLKDAAAKAIYGSKAANGVVVIETKLPAQGNLRISYNGSLDIEAPDLTSYNLANAREKLEAEVLAGKYINNINAYDQANLTRQYNELYKEVERGVNTYWLSKPLRTGVGQKHSLYMDGGDNAMRYSINVGYNNIIGVMKGSDRETISGSVTLSYRYKTLSFRNQLSIDDNVATNSKYGSFTRYAQLNPYWREKDENGNYVKALDTSSGIYNPLYDAQLKSKNYSTYTTITENFYGEWDMIDNLRLTARFGLTKTVNENHDFKPADHSDFDYITKLSDDYNKRGSYTKGNGKAKTLSTDIGLAYSFNRDKHLLYANAVYSLSENRSESNSVTVVGFPSDKMDNIAFANSYQDGTTPTGSESTSRDLGFTLSVNYSYDNRYLADFSYRTNASSQFGSKERWGQFWSVGLGWNLHYEKFMKNLTWLDIFKIRASIGYTGAQNFNSYQSMATYQYNTEDNYNGEMGLYLQGLPNPDLKWQQQYDQNIGADINLFNSLSIKLDLYSSKTKDLLVDMTLPPSVGFISYKENVGETENKGYQIGANYRLYNYQAKRTYINLFFNIAGNTNKIVKISNSLKASNESQDAIKDNDSQYGGNNQQRVPSTRYEEGQSMSAIWVVPSKGIDPVTGKEVFVKKDGSLTYVWSSEDQIVGGDSNPKYNGNFGTSIQYKNISFNASFTFRGGGQTYNSTLVDKLENVNVATHNIDKRVLADRWNTPGVEAKYKAITDNTTTKPTSRFVEDLNEVVFSAFSLAYDFSNINFIRQSVVERLRLTFNMNDVARISTVKQERGTSYPFARTFSFSLQASF